MFPNFHDYKELIQNNLNLNSKEYAKTFKMSNSILKSL